MNYKQFLYIHGKQLRLYHITTMNNSKMVSLSVNHYSTLFTVKPIADDGSTWLLSVKDPFRKNTSPSIQLERRGLEMLLSSLDIIEDKGNEMYVYGKPINVFFKNVKEATYNGNRYSFAETSGGILKRIKPGSNIRQSFQLMQRENGPLRLQIIIQEWKDNKCISRMKLEEGLVRKLLADRHEFLDKLHRYSVL